MRISHSNVCVTYLKDGTHETAMTEIGRTSEDAVVEEPQLAEG